MSSSIRIKAVDGGAAATNALLRWLQLEILPLDTPTDTDVGFWWVAYEGSTPAGFCGLYHSATDPEGGYLCRAGVLPSFRGRHLQRKLIAVRERKARELGMKTLVTDTFCNPQSSNNLIACGYRMFSPVKRWGFDAACYWKKNLS